MQRIAITGSSGYFGQKLVAALKAEFPQAQILGLDVNEATKVKPDHFVKKDIRDKDLVNELKSFAPDTVVHLAFIVNPMHDEALMHSINIDGTQNLLDAVAAIKPARLFVASSVTAYGAHWDNPVPMDESWPVRPRQEFLYAADKTEMDLMINRFAQAHKDIATAWVRPAIIYGPGVENYLSRMVAGAPVQVLIDDYDMPIQFVHEDDVVGASMAILKASACGPFNVTPTDWLTLSEVAKELGKKTRSVPFAIAYALTWVLWNLKVKSAEAPPGILYFFKYPWVATPKRLTQELGYTFKYNTQQTLQEMIESRK